jgi:N-acyl-D-amino-acid deacylase
MTGLTARRFGLATRGELRVGAAADVTLFDAEQVLDGATFDLPVAAPCGIRWVLVNGRIAVEEGRQADDRAGQILRRVPA